MKYFLALGNHPELSKAEISAVLYQKKIIFSEVFSHDSILIIDTPKIIEPDFLDILGGTIKLGEILTTMDQSVDLTEILFKQLKVADKKLFFGISYYNKKYYNVNKLGFELKEKLKQQGVSSRFVTGQENPLSSVIVKKNKLVSDHGQELILIFDDKKQIHLGKTSAVQDFQKYSKFDFGRPGRDDFSGMLPPKVAQIMINLAGVNNKQTILDPFCGSGTILQMAGLMGYQSLLGSDISEKAIRDTQKNFVWLDLPLTPKITQCSATDLHECLPPQSVDAIITEPYLGHPLKGNESPKFLEKSIAELSNLYNQSLNEFKKILKPNGTIIMIIPEFIIRGKSYHCTINEKPEKTWRYAREGQRVIRHIWKIKI